MNELILKFNRLNHFHQQEVMDFLDFLLSKQQSTASPEKTDEAIEKRQQAAALLLEDYLQDEDLVAFTTLDIDDFYEAK